MTQKKKLCCTRFFTVLSIYGKVGFLQSISGRKPTIKATPDFLISESILFGIRVKYKYRGLPIRLPAGLPAGLSAGESVSFHFGTFRGLPVGLPVGLPAGQSVGFHFISNNYAVQESALLV